MQLPPGSQLVFQQVMTAPVNGGFGPTANSDSKFNDWLGKADELRLFAVVDRASGPAGILTITLQDSSDEELYWRTTSTPINQVGLSNSDVTVLSAMEGEGVRGPGLAFRRLLVQLGSDNINGISARVRIWATCRSGYRRFHRLLLAERLQGTNVLYAPLEACASIVGTDRVIISFLAEELAGASPTLTVLLGESPNGRAWSDLPAGPYPIWSQPSGVTFLNDAVPWSGFLRLGVQLGGTNPAASVRLWVTGRDVHPG